MLLASFANIRLGLKGFPGTKSLAYLGITIIFVMTLIKMSILITTLLIMTILIKLNTDDITYY
jgi:hypothetical protein